MTGIPRACAPLVSRHIHRPDCRWRAVHGVQLARDVPHLDVRVGRADRLRACRRSGARGERRCRPSRCHVARLVPRIVGGACVRARSQHPSRRRWWSFSSGASHYRASLWASTPRSDSRRSLRLAAFSWSLRRSLVAAGVRTRKASPCLGKPPRIFPQIKEHFGAIRPNSLMIWWFVRAGLRLAYTTTRQIIRSRGLLVGLRSTLLLFLSSECPRHLVGVRFV